MVERKQILDGREVRAGDKVIGLASSGLHSNGYSLARKLAFEVAGLSPDSFVPELGRTRRRRVPDADPDLRRRR